jgi:signal transduction histidine kinase
MYGLKNMVNERMDAQNWTYRWRRTLNEIMTNFEWNDDEHQTKWWRTLDETDTNIEHNGDEHRTEVDWTLDGSKMEVEWKSNGSRTDVRQTSNEHRTKVGWKLAERQNDGTTEQLATMTNCDTTTDECGDLQCNKRRHNIHVFTNATL